MLTAKASAYYRKDGRIADLYAICTLLGNHKSPRRCVGDCANETSLITARSKGMAQMQMRLRFFAFSDATPGAKRNEGSDASVIIHDIDDPVQGRQQMTR